MPGTRHFDFDQVSVVAMGIPIFEYGEGGTVTLSLSEDDYVVKQGHHGSVIRARKPNNVAELTVQVMYGSPVNAVLSARMNADRATGFGTGEMLCKDTNGSTVAAATTSWVKKMPDFKFATETDMVEWVFTCTGLTTLVHGTNRLA